jgi:predicted amidohydrolase
MSRRQRQAAGGGCWWGVAMAAVYLTPMACSHGIAAEPRGRPSRLVVAVMRVQPKRWDKAHNFELLTRFATDAARRGARLVLTCEGFLDGYTGNPSHSPGLTREKYLQIGEPLDGPWIGRACELARKLHIHLAIGFAERRGTQMFNSLIVIDPSGETVLHYSKTHTKGEIFNTPGSGLPVATTEVGTLGALICYDRRFPEVPRILALKGAQILLIPAYGTDGEKNEALLRTRAWENSVWVLYARQDQALVINPSGKIVARDTQDGDQLVLAEIELDDQVGTGDILHRRAPQFYRELIELSAPPAEPTLSESNTQHTLPGVD